MKLLKKVTRADLEVAFAAAETKPSQETDFVDVAVFAHVEQIFPSLLANHHAMSGHDGATWKDCRTCRTLLESP